MGNEPFGGFCVCAWEDDLLLPNVRSASRLPPDPKSVLVRAFPYYTGEREGRNLSLYAVIPDYHAVVLSLLEESRLRLCAAYPENRFVSFCDASPVDEVTAGLRAGAGILGKNGLLITKDFGSLVFLGEIVTDLSLPAKRKTAHCADCGACVRACPTGALTKDGLTPSLCLSHITQKKGALSEQEALALRAGGHAWGCDCCLLACPHNHDPKKTPIEAFLSGTEPVLTAANLSRLMHNRAFAWRGRAVLERNLALLQKPDE